MGTNHSESISYSIGTSHESTHSTGKSWRESEIHSGSECVGYSYGGSPAIVRRLMLRDQLSDFLDSETDEVVIAAIKKLLALLR